MDNSDKVIMEAIQRSNLSIVQELLDVINVEALYNLMSVYGGDTIYIPKLDRFAKEERNERICKEISLGATYGQLAKKYNMATRSIRDIIDKNGKR